MLIKNIPRKEPKGCFLPAAPGWHGFEGCCPHPTKSTAHRSSGPQGLFLAPAKKDWEGAGGRQHAGRCLDPGAMMASSSSWCPSHPPPALLASVPLREGDRRLAPSQPRWGTIRGTLTPRRPDVSRHHHRHHRQPWPGAPVRPWLGPRWKPPVCLSSSPALLVLMAHPPPPHRVPGSSHEPATSCLLRSCARLAEMWSSHPRHAGHSR